MRDWGTTARGYGAEHQKLRRRWAPIVEAGGVACSLCGRLIVPGTPWDLGHSVDRTVWTGPQHRRCNRSEGATRGNRQRRTRTTTSRAW